MALIVPRFWAEGRAQAGSSRKTTTVRRFGWSDVSLEDAQANADQRAQEALQRVLRGEKLHRRDLKRGYNGSDGVPIREEILHAEGTSVITRNAYGAHCLNTPNVLFADMDFRREPGVLLTVITLVFGVGTGVWVGIATSSFLTGLALSLAGGFVAPLLAYALDWTARATLGGDDNLAKRRIDRFVRKHPDWHLRIYKTPNGIRVLVMHRTFDPTEDSVQEFFRALSVDSIYVRMCRNQRCFRARLTAKPWRIGIGDRMKPRPGVWPLREEQLPRRNQWIARYEVAATGYAACRFLESMGATAVHPEAAAVQDLHDRWSRACSSLPIA